MRQNIRPNPSEKLFEAYLDFSDGLNTATSNEKLKDVECPVLENVDLSTKSSAKMRYGRRKLLSISGNAQGMFFYHRQDQPEPDIILAISGKLYYKSGDEGVRIPITDGENTDFTFQETLPIEGVQYDKDLFIATGTKLVELTYDEDSEAFLAKVVVPYTPTVLEAIYIGTNALAANPDAYVQDGEAESLSVAGIKPARRQVVVNEKMSMTAYINKPTSITAVEYQWEFKKSADATWTVGRAWTEGTAGKTWDFLADTATNYDIRVTVRNKAATSTTANYTLTNYPVRQVEDGDSKTLPVDDIQRCRKILLHWDRLVLALDNNNPYQIYVSDLQNPRYMPVTNTINFNEGKQEAITSIVRYRDMLVVFTKTTIHALVGKSVEDYRRNLIHDGIGCVAGKSAKVVGNNVIFLSFDGIYALRPNPYHLEVLNVSRADTRIKPSIPIHTDACAITTDSQYWIAFPQNKEIFRFYYDTGAWTKDKSNRLDIVEFDQYGENVYNLTKNGDLLLHDKNVFTDDGEKYKMVLETKALDLSSKFNQKKLKRLYILARHYASHNVELKIAIFADAAKILGDDLVGEAVVDEDGYVVWQPKEIPTIDLYAGTVFASWLMGISSWGSPEVSVQRVAVRGKCRRVKVRFEYDGGNPCEIYGFGLEFKLKKV